MQDRIVVLEAQLQDRIVVLEAQPPPQAAGQGRAGLTMHAPMHQGHPGM